MAGHMSLGGAKTTFAITTRVLNDRSCPVLCGIVARVGFLNFGSQCQLSDTRIPVRLRPLDKLLIDVRRP